jgi:hypothetical protein
MAAWAPAGVATAPRGTVVLRGGVKATVRLSPANCTTGPGLTFLLDGVKTGSWDLVFLRASKPAGKPAAASIDLVGQGFKKNQAAVATWSAHGRGGVSLGPAARFGAIRQTLRLVSSENGPAPTSVRVAASWGSGACKEAE